MPGYDTAIWHGIAAPKNTPTDIIGRLNKEINAVLADPKIKERFAENGGVPIGGSPADLAKFMTRENEVGRCNPGGQHQARVGLVTAMWPKC